MKREISYEEFEKLFNNLNENEILEFCTVDGDSDNEWSNYKIGYQEVEFDEFCTTVKMMSYLHNAADDTGVGSCFCIDLRESVDIFEEMLEYSKEGKLYICEEEINIDNIIFNGTKYPYREIKSVNDDMLDTWVVGPESMKDGWGDDASTYPRVDDMYFCYVPDAVFNEYSDSQLAEYIVRNFLC